MNSERTLDEHEVNSIENDSINWKHFFKYYGIQLILTTVVFLIFHMFRDNYYLMKFTDVYFIVPPLLIFLMFHTYKGRALLKLKQKIIPFIGVIIVGIIGHFLLLILSNGYYQISDETLISAFQMTGIISSIWFVVSIPIVIFVKSRIKNDY